MRHMTQSTILGVNSPNVTNFKKNLTSKLNDKFGLK